MLHARVTEGDSYNCKLIFKGNRSKHSHEAHLVGDKIQSNGHILKLATLVSLYEEEEGIVVCLRASEARIFYTAIDNCQLLQYGQAYKLNDGTKTMDVQTCIQWNSTKTEWLHLRTIVKRNVNFLLTTTVHISMGICDVA